MIPIERPSATSSECADIARWNRSTQDPLFQIIASLRLHNAAGWVFIVSARTNFFRSGGEGQIGASAGPRSGRVDSTGPRN